VPLDTTHANKITRIRTPALKVPTTYVNPSVFNGKTVLRD